MTTRTRPFSPEFLGFSRYNESGPGGAGNTTRSLTRSSDFTREGLAVDATQIPQRVIARALTNIDIDPERGCWISRYSVGSHGYAQIGWHNPGLGRSTMTLVHRVAYAARRGPIPDDMTVDHMCKQRRCCNPDHLRLLSNYENARRTWGKDWPIGVCINGHPNSHLEMFGGSKRCGLCHRSQSCTDCGIAVSARATRCTSCNPKWLAVLRSA